MSNRCVDKVVEHIYNGILFSPPKEWNWVIFSDVDETSAGMQSEVSQKEKSKYRILTHIWNLEEWDWWTYFQGRNRNKDVENGLVDSEQEEEHGTV